MSPSLFSVWQCLYSLLIFLMPVMSLLELVKVGKKSVLDWTDNQTTKSDLSEDIHKDILLQNYVLLLCLLEKEIYDIT